MRRRRINVSIGLVICIAVSGCASVGVEISRSDQSETASSTDESTTTTEADTPAPTSQPDLAPPVDDGLPEIGPVAWTSCSMQPAPWQCGEIVVPLNYADLAGQQVTIALTRLPAADPARRTGSLVLNPGGPGGSGILIAFTEASSFPSSVLDRFDVVGFDPRGVGESTGVRCPPEFDAAVDSYEACIELNRDLLPHLGTPNVARDLEMLRKAVGDERLTYLGYSYGTALGAVFADMFPDRIRAMVLDGAIDPDAGLSNVDGGGGYDFYAEQDFDGTLEVFHTLCDETSLCAAGPNSRELLNDVYDTVRDTPAPYFAGHDRVTRSDVDDIVYSAMYSAYDWAFLGIALRDAANGDASTLAAMNSWLQFGYPAEMESQTNYDFANIAIRCADFENRGAGSYECEQFPETAEPLPVITAIDASTPILVVGTRDDPATPGRYADQLADALGDAVDINWDGAGHTAYLTSGCISDLVTSYLIDQIVPADGETCAFVPDAATVTERADAVFADLDPAGAVDAIEPLVAESEVPAGLVRCVAEGIVRREDERLIVHQFLGVESPDLINLRSVVAMRCLAGG